MGPYCKFCNNRCFVPFPEGTPQEVFDAYNASCLSRSVSIIATCSKGQAYEKEKTGWCLDDIKQSINKPYNKKG